MGWECRAAVHALPQNMLPNTACIQRQAPEPDSINVHAPMPSTSHGCTSPPYLYHPPAISLQFINMVFLAVTWRLVTKMYSGNPVARLPFRPPGFMLRSGTPCPHHGMHMRRVGDPGVQGHAHIRGMVKEASGSGARLY